MSSDQVSERAKQTLRVVKEMLGKAEVAAQKALDRAAPAVQKSVGASMDAAAKGFSATMQSIDGATSREQVEFLKAYRRVLQGQVEFVDARIKDLGARSQSKQ